MKLGAVVVALLTEPDEVLAGLGDVLAVQLHVQRPRVGHEAHVRLLLHPRVPHDVVLEHGGLVLLYPRHRGGREGCGNLEIEDFRETPEEQQTTSCSKIHFEDPLFKLSQ